MFASINQTHKSFMYNQLVPHQSLLQSTRGCSLTMSQHAAYDSSTDPVQTVLIAGASSGIGHAVAVELARTGRRVVLLARRQRALEEVAELIRSSHGDVQIYTGDAADTGDAKAAVEVAATGGSVVALVNCVGTNTPKRALHDLNRETWEQMLRANLDSAYVLTQAILPIFRQQQHGLLVHVSSRAVHQPDGSGVAYQAAKAGVAALAHATMVEEQANGVRVSVVYPGMTATPLLHKRPTPPTEDDLRRALQPEDVAAAIRTIVDLPQRAYIPNLAIYPTN